MPHLYQEVFSRTRGVGINLAIKYYRVLLCSSEAPARYTTTNNQYYSGTSLTTSEMTTVDIMSYLCYYVHNN